MSINKIVLRVGRRIARWLRMFKMSILLAGVIFFILMYLDIPGFQASDTDKVFGSIVLALGLINFTYWTFLNRQAAQAQEKRRIKGKRKP
ncbi:hypothetical protein [Methanocella arvoryzae]|uniref:hypothetical protein n=1 Tax=Methanocella arvoryzae TaxID=1175445 RepID=UPI000325A311|nr:hypothetical protein [Methanocella arvoryzae]